MFCGHGSVLARGSLMGSFLSPILKSEGTLMSTLEEEVRTLQTQVRGQRRWNIALGALGALGALVVGGGLMAATSSRSVPDVIQAKKFEVVNDEGKVLVRLGANVDGNGLVKTQNGKGQTLVVLSSYTGQRGGYVETYTTTGTSTGEIP